MQNTIVQVTPNNWQEYKQIRLIALKEDPQAFGSAYETEIEFPDSKWQERASDTHTINLIAKDGNRVIGMASVYWENYLKAKHIAHIFGVYVDTQYRGKGIGRMLLEEIEKRAKENSQTEKISLEVVADQQAALQLYKKLGYREVGKQEKQLKTGERYFDSYIMEKLI